MKPASTSPGTPKATLQGRRNLPLLLLMARERVLRRFRPLLLAQGVTEPQWRIVRALHDLGPMEPRQIGAVCVISSASLTGVLARMDEQGWVRRERMAHDQRRVQVTLTPRSNRLVRRLAPLIAATYEALDADLGEGFMRELHAALDRVVDGLDGHADHPSHAEPRDPVVHLALDRPEGHDQASG